MNISEIESAIKFCKAGVGDAKAPEEQCCYRILDGRLYSHNGTMTFSAPIPLEFDANPNANDFEAAIQNCEDNFNLGFNGSKIVVRSGKFSAKVDCVTQGFEIYFGSDCVDPIGCPILPAIRALLPFVGQDDKRPHFKGILFRGQSAFATCNVIIIEHWMGVKRNVEFVIPEAGLKTLLKLNEEPVGLAVDSSSVTVHLSGDRWFRIPTFEQSWPNMLTIFAMSNWNDVPETPVELFPSMARLHAFSGPMALAQIQPGKLSVGNGAMEVAGLTGTAKVHWKFLRMLDGVATRISFSDALRVRFIGKGVRGILAGVGAS